MARSISDAVCDVFSQVYRRRCRDVDLRQINVFYIRLTCDIVLDVLVKMAEDVNLTSTDR